MDIVKTKYNIKEVMHNKEFNKFLDGIMKSREVVRITLADHLIESGWDSCDLDLDVEIKGGSVGPELGKFLLNYETVHLITSINKKTGQEEISGHHGSKFWKVGPYFLEIAWGHKPFTVPYLVLRERGIRKKGWLQKV